MMGRDPRTYITVHDGMPEHPKVEPLSDAAFRLLVETWCYSSRNLSDGYVTAAVWARRGTKRTRAELEAAGLVEAAEGGVQMHDYTEHQRTRAEVDQQRSRNAENGRKGGQAKAANRAATAKQPAKRTPSKPVATRYQVASESLSESSSESLPVSVSVTEAEITTPPGGADAPDEVVYAELVDDQPNAQTLVAEWIDHCNGHRPPGRVIGQVAKELGALVAEGIPADDIRRGVASWHGKGLHPSTIASEVHSVRTMTRRTPGPTRHESEADDLRRRQREAAAAYDQGRATA